jgi:hypothetical protein
MDFTLSHKGRRWAGMDRIAKRNSRELPLDQSWEKTQIFKNARYLGSMFEMATICAPQNSSRLTDLAAFINRLAAVGLLLF